MWSTRNSIQCLRFAVWSRGVRNNIIDTIQINCADEWFTNDFCNHLREFKRDSLDEYSKITFTLPNKVKIYITTPRVDGKTLVYDIPHLPTTPDKAFQKSRWWKFI